MSSGAFSPMSREEFADFLKESSTTRMPFGRYGPENCPPSGLPIARLPLEYLLWFKARGFPKNRVGELLQFVCELKEAGCEEFFPVDFSQKRRK